MSETKQGTAFALGIVTMLCTVVAYGAFALTVLLVGHLLEDMGDQTDGPPFYPGIVAVPWILVVVVTFPVGLLCTIGAWFLGGFRHSKLAWVSFSVYVLPIALYILFGL